MPSATRVIPIEQFRATAIAAQLLGKYHGSSVTDIVERAGFVRTLGGVDVYLALRARSSKLDCRDLEQAVEDRRLQVLPAARGCIYLVSRHHASIALCFAALQRAARDAKEQEKAGIQEGELDQTGLAILSTLRAMGPLSTTQLRKHLPEGSYRSLGAAGKKLGISSTLPPALRQLEFEGSIERLMEERRLDSERYRWRIYEGSRNDCSKKDPDQLNQLLARIFFRAAGLATKKMFAAWSGLSQSAARKALQQLDLQRYEVSGEGEPFLGFEMEDTITPESHRDSVAFLPFEDNLLALQGGPRLMVDPEFRDIQVPVWGRSRGSRLGDAKHSSLRTILAGNRLAGFWEFDPESQQVVTHCFAPLSSTQKDAVATQAREVGILLMEQLGNARSFSLDTDKALLARSQFIRSLGA